MCACQALIDPVTSFTQFVSVCSVLKEQVSKESNALSVSKEFLRKQRQSLKRRQAALQAAKQELTRDVLRQKQGVRDFILTFSLLAVTFVVC